MINQLLRTSLNGKAFVSSILARRFSVTAISLAATSHTPKQVPISEVNDYHGLRLNQQWFFIPKKYYAADWTIPELQKEITKKYGTQQVKDDKIQQIIDEWCGNVHIKAKPKPTKLTRKAKAELQNELLFKKQASLVAKEKKREKKKKDLATDKANKLSQKQSREEENRRICLYVLEHNRLPDDYDYDSVTLTNVWNHYSAKHYSDNLSRQELKKKVSSLWADLTPEEKEVERQDYIQTMKNGQAYKQGKLVPLREKYSKLKYKILEQFKNGAGKGKARAK